MSDPRFPGDPPSPNTTADRDRGDRDRSGGDLDRDADQAELSRTIGPATEVPATQMPADVDAPAVARWGEQAPAPQPPQSAAEAATATSPKRATPTGSRVANRARPSIAVRVFATFALAAAVTTYVAVEVDLVRRHFPGVDPIKYWVPQLQQVTLPGLGAVAICALVALALHKLQRRRT